MMLTAGKLDSATVEGILAKLKSDPKVKPDDLTRYRKAAGLLREFMEQQPWWKFW
jgi:hypothetical protein